MKENIGASLKGCFLAFCLDTLMDIDQAKREVVYVG